MSVAYIDRGATTSSFTTSIVANYPTTVSLNDIALLRLSAPNGSTATPTTPTGYALLNSSIDATNGEALWIYWKRCAGTESGGTVTVTTGTAATWTATISTYSGVRTTGNPHAHTLAGSQASGSSFTTAVLTVDSSGPSGTSFEVAYAAGNTSGSNIYSGEVWSNLTAVAGTNVEQRDSGGVMFFTQQSSAGASSSFSAGVSNHAYVWVLLDLVESPTAPNRTPTANAGPDQTVAAGTLVTLDGSASSDPDSGDTLSYAWTHVSGPSTLAALSNPALPKPTYTPTTSGVDVWSLIVTDNHGASSTADTVSITATNRAPIAAAAFPSVVATGSTVTLDATQSHDPDTGDTLTYAWTAVSGPNAAGTHTTASFSYTATSPGTDVWHLVVTDNHGSSSATLTVSVVAGAAGVRIRVNGQWFEALCKERVSGAWVQV